MRSLAAFLGLCDKLLATLFFLRFAQLLGLDKAPDPTQRHRQPDQPNRPPKQPENGTYLHISKVDGSDPRDYRRKSPKWHQDDQAGESCHPGRADLAWASGSKHRRPT